MRAVNPYLDCHSRAIEEASTGATNFQLVIHAKSTQKELNFKSSRDWLCQHHCGKLIKSVHNIMKPGIHLQKIKEAELKMPAGVD